MKKACFALCICLTVGGCASVRTRMSRISPGMTKDEVIKIMGAPGDRQFQGNLEALQWCSTGALSDDFVLVWLNDGHVTGMNSYNNHMDGFSCSGFYKTIRWEDAPTASLEIRQR